MIQQIVPALRSQRVPVSHASAEGISLPVPGKLTNMGLDDDPEAFLVTFERVALAE